jgi:hypothetical protein
MDEQPACNVIEMRCVMLSETLCSLAASTMRIGRCKSLFEVLLFFAAGIVLAGSIAGCASPAVIMQDFCASESLLADAHFEGGNLGACIVSDQGVFELTLHPENDPPINVAPWYAFRLSGKPGQQAVVQMQFEHGYARYWPKISHDGENWARLNEEQVLISDDGTHMEIRLVLDQARMWVAGQEITASAYYDDWIRDLSTHEDIATRLAGNSVQGRPIYMAETADRKEMILLLGRQHPPEVAGALAMRPFVDTLLSDTELARQFRERFKLVVFPLLNPDGVVAGYWRHNVNGTDLNRDWGLFTQPETQLVRDWMSDAGNNGIQIRLMLDFHATKRNIFYTQRDVDDQMLAGFTRHWLMSAAERLPEYEFERDAEEPSDQANSKNYFHMTYGIPAITYELGDETRRDLIESSAIVFAEEMMRAMLQVRPD